MWQDRNRTFTGTSKVLTLKPTPFLVTFVEPSWRPDMFSIIIKEAIKLNQIYMKNLWSAQNVVKVSEIKLLQRNTWKPTLEWRNISVIFVRKISWSAVIWLFTWKDTIRILTLFAIFVGKGLLKGGIWRNTWWRNMKSICNILFIYSDTINESIGPSFAYIM